MPFFRANLIGLKADRDKKEIGTGPPRLNLGYAHQDCGTRSLVIKIPVPQSNTMHGQPFNPRCGPPVHQRSWAALTGYPTADCAGPVQLRARTACCPRAPMACAVIARLACRGWPAPLTNSGTAVYPRTTRRPQSTRPHSLR